MYEYVYFVTIKDMIDFERILINNGYSNNDKPYYYGLSGITKYPNFPHNNYFAFGMQEPQFTVKSYFLTVISKDRSNCYYFPKEKDKIMKRFNLQEVVPSYSPKRTIKRTLENKLNEDFFSTLDSLNSYLRTYPFVIPPTIKIGDTIRLKYKFDEIYYNLSSKYEMSVDDEVIKTLKTIKDKEFKVVQKFKYTNSDRHPWWSCVIYNDREQWIMDDLVTNAPQYKPRKKVDRIIEERKWEGESNFRVWCKTVDSAIEFEDFMYSHMGWRWNYPDNRDDRITIDTPSMFIFFTDKKKFDSYNWCNKDDMEPTDIVYEYPKDINIIKEKLGVIPSYKPKNIVKRILESDNFYKYRFKTKKEFFDQYGSNWRDRATNGQCFFAEEMDYLLGTSLERYFPDDVEEITIPRKPEQIIDGDIVWYINRNFLKLKETKPSYKPKDRIERTLERLNEGYTNFKTNDELVKFLESSKVDNPLFEIGNFIKMKPNVMELYEHTGQQTDRYTKWLLLNRNRNMKIYELSYADLAKNWYYRVDDMYWIYQDFVVKGEPIYRSKDRIERTLESNMEYPYRFKTKQEFIQQYGEDWRDAIRTNNYPNWAEHGGMDHLFGKPFPFTNDQLDLKNLRFPLGDITRWDDPESVYDWKISWRMLTPNKPKVPTYKPKDRIERTLESKKFDSPFSAIIFVVNNDEENRITQENMFKFGFKWHSKGQEVRTFRENMYPIYLFLELDLFDIGHNIINYMSLNDRSETIEKYIEDVSKEENICKKVFSYEDAPYIENIIKNGLSRPSYKPKDRIERTLESFQGNKETLYIFDFDDTLVYSDRFEDRVKHLVKENVKPDDILRTEVSKLGINLSDLKYENGRIYLLDEEGKINIPDSSSWVRKKNRIYLVQPESYYMTDESIPIGTYQKMVDLYNSVQNKMILTARKEKLRSKVLKILDKFRIQLPNFGLCMYPDNASIFSSRWKAEKIIEVSKNNSFTEIHYFDDNVKQIKKIKKFLRDSNINIYFYRVDKNTYRLYEDN